MSQLCPGVISHLMGSLGNTTACLLTCRCVLHPVNELSHEPLQQTPWSMRILSCSRTQFFCSPQVHWFSILNSMMVVVVMSCIVAMIMMRTIRKDLAQYEALIVDSGGAHFLEIGPS